LHHDSRIFLPEYSLHIGVVRKGVVAGVLISVCGKQKYRMTCPFYE